MKCYKNVFNQNNISATMSAMNNGAQLLPSEEKSEEYITAEFHRQL